MARKNEKRELNQMDLNPPGGNIFLLESPLLIFFSTLLFQSLNMMKKDLQCLLIFDISKSFIYFFQRIS